MVALLLAMTVVFPGTQESRKPEVPLPVVSKADKQKIFAWLDSFGYGRKLSGDCYVTESLGKDGKGKIVVGARHYEIRSSGTTTYVETAQATVRITDYIDKRTKRKLLPATILKERLAEQATYGRDIGHRWRSVIPPVYWARFAEAKGYPQLADRFLSWAADTAREKDLFSEIKTEVGDGEAYAILDDLGEVKRVSWATYRKRYAEFVKRFPNHEYAFEARDCVVQLDRMLAEAKKRPKTKPRTTDDKVAALIYDLRNDTGYEESSVAETKLVKFGLAAVPQLIKALDDPSLTPGQGYSGAMEHRWIPQVSRVAERAAGVLGEIAGRDFELGFGPNTTWQERLADAKQEVLAWWADNKQKGERETLIEGVLLATWDSMTQAELLAKKYPKDAPAVIEQAMINHRDRKRPAWQRGHMVEALQFAKVPAAKELLTKVLASDEEIRVKVDAAQALAKFNFGEGLAESMRLWREGPWDDGGLMLSLVPFLVDACSAAAIEALRDGLLSRPGRAREIVVNIVGVAFKPPTQGEVRRKVTVREKAAFTAASERLLAEALDDEGFGGWNDVEGNGVTLKKPRISDLAARALGSLDPSATGSRSIQPISRWTPRRRGSRRHGRRKGSSQVWSAVRKHRFGLAAQAAWPYKFYPSTGPRAGCGSPDDEEERWPVVSSFTGSADFSRLGGARPCLGENEVSVLLSRSHV